MALVEPRSLKLGVDIGDVQLLVNPRAKICQRRYPNAKKVYGYALWLADSQDWSLSNEIGRS